VNALLLTGATGLVGGGLLRHLLAARPARRITGLGIDGFVCVDGDITRPDLGVAAPVLREIRDSVTEVIHCAADTSFTIPLAQARAVNVAGTANVLALARRCRRLHKFAHVSTTYVAGLRAGAIPEAAVRATDGYCNAYQQSKHEAEALVLEAAAALPASIYRLSTIIGDARTGRVRQFNYVHQLLRLVPRNLLPIVPGDPAAPIDLIPYEWATAALAYLIEARFAPGRVHHLCAGAEGSLTIAELRERALRVYAEHPMGQRWSPIYPPELVSLERYRAYVEESRAGGDVLLNEVLRALDCFLPHLAVTQTFDTRATQPILDAQGLSVPPVRDYFEKMIAYCLESGWGAREPTRVARGA
jgi:nucleoside-diphosphate-sugar epimerase